MQRIKKSVAGFPGAGPLVVQAGQSALVEVDGARPNAQPPNQFLLHHSEHDKNDDWNRQKLNECGVAQQNKRGNQRQRGNHELGESQPLLATLFCALLPLKLMQSMGVHPDGSLLMACIHASRLQR